MKDTILGFIRHILTFGGGFLVGKDIIGDGQLEVAVAAIMTLVGIVWSAIDKKKRT